MLCMIALTVAEQPSTITATAQYSTVTRLTVTQPKRKQSGWRLWRCAISKKVILLDLNFVWLIGFTLCTKRHKS